MLDHTLSFLHTYTGVLISFYIHHAPTFSCAPPLLPPSSAISLLSLYSLFSLSRYFLHVTGCVWMLLNETQEQRLRTWATERLLTGQSWRIQYSAAIYCAGLLMFGEDVGPTTVRWEGAEERAEERAEVDTGEKAVLPSVRVERDGGTCIVRRKRIGDEREGRRADQQGGTC